MEKIKFNVPSSDGVHTLAGVVYLPGIEPIGFFHIVHGMVEHIGRYDKFMRDMAERGYICFGYDNLGHGYTAKDKSELGYIAKKNGYDFLSRDVKLFSDAVIKKYSADKELPYYLMGHSMGSFITRHSVTKYVKPDKFIIMGTGGKNPAAPIGLAVIAVIKLFFGDKHISNFVNSLAFSGYNKRFSGFSAVDPSQWLSTDKAEREKYYADEFCSFKFTVSAMGDLVRLNKITNENSWYKAIPRSVSVLLVSGGEDPVGDYGKGVREVYSKLKKHGVAARCVIYPEARHEILNDFTYESTKNEILDFLKA